MTSYTDYVSPLADSFGLGFSFVWPPLTGPCRRKRGVSCFLFFNFAGSLLGVFYSRRWPPHRLNLGTVIRGAKASNQLVP